MSAKRNSTLISDLHVVLDRTWASPCQLPVKTASNTAAEAIGLERHRSMKLPNKNDAEQLYPNRLLAAAGKHGSIQHYIRLFETQNTQLAQREEASRFLIDSYLAERQPRLAKAVLLKTRNDGMNVSRERCEAIFDELLMRGDVLGTGEVYEVMQTDDDVWDEGRMRKMAWLYAKYGYALKARKVYDDYKGQGYREDERRYSTMILGYTKAGDMKNAFSSYDEMRLKGINATARTYQVLICAQSKLGNREAAKKLRNEALECGHTRNIEVHSAYFDGLEKWGTIKEMMAFLRELGQVYGLVLNRSIYSILLRGLCRRRMIEEAKMVYKKFLGAGYKPNFFLLTTMINLMGRAGDLSAAKSTFEEIEKLGFDPNAFHYASLATAMNHAGQFDDALALIGEMEEKQVAKDEYIYRVLMFAHTGRRDLEQVIHTFRSIEAQGITRTHISYGVLLKALLTFGDYERGLLWYAEMIRKKVRPDLDCYATALEIAMKKRDSVATKSILRHLEGNKRNLPSLSSRRLTGLKEQVTKFLHEVDGFSYPPPPRRSDTSLK